MRVAVVGAGLSGLGAAYELAKAGVKVCLYDKEDKLGGRHANTVTIDGVSLDLGLMLFNRVTYPDVMGLFDSLGVETEECDTSFSVSLDKGLGCEWGTRNGLSGFFARKTNLLNPYFWKMLSELIKFKDDVLKYLDEQDNAPKLDRTRTLGSFIKSKGYSDLFQRAYLMPMCASVWPCDHSQKVLDFPAFSILSCFRDNHMLQLFGGRQSFTLKGRSHCYVNKVTKELVDRGCLIRTNCEVHYVSTSDEGCKIFFGDGSEDDYDGCILAIHAPDALKILGSQATHNERVTLGAFQYFHSDIFLHQDKSLMPRNLSAWSALNVLGSSNGQISLTYLLNVIQNIDMGDHQPYLVTLNPLDVPKNVLMKWSTRHHIPSVAASKASLQMNNIQGKRRLWFSGAYQGYGFLEDGLKASLVVAQSVLGRNCIVPQSPKPMATSWAETASRIVTTKFLRRFISTGCLVILEDGGEVLIFQGANKKCTQKVVIKVHNPQFYSKVCLEADLGLADAYINGDFSLVDENEGLLNLIKLFIANSDSNSSDKKRNWWTPILFTSSIASAKYMYRHFSRQNSMTQARRNISRHYDMGNEIFSIFMGETMSYSCAMFKSIDEDLGEAQRRKMRVIIKKARIEENHEVLELGCGWGIFAIEVVKQTGCKYTGITLSQEQLRYAEKRVKESGFQFISCQDDRYDEYRRCPCFMKEYIFPGGCLPSLSRITSCMAVASKLCVEDIENIGVHYYQTLRCWRQNFLEQQRKILSLGFDEKFIRTYEYYFDYCAAGFYSRIVYDYQVVFSRPGHVVPYNNPYEGGV